MKYIGSVVTDAGIRKKINQDSVCLKIAELKNRGQIAMAIVCDGMGGLQKGELASAEVIRAFSDWFDRILPSILNDYTWLNMRNIWCEMIINLNNRLLHYGKETNVSLGTTFSGLLCIEDKYMILHVGDSRIYSINNNMIQLTEDHTLVNKKIKMGLITSEEAEIDNQRNVLTQCIGASQKVTPQVIFGKVNPNTIYLLCSDGFRHVLTSREIFDELHPSKLNTTDCMDQAGRKLIEIVKFRNEMDNITVALLKSINE